MVFSSNIFLFCFLPLVLLGYYLIRIEYRNLFLLVSSLLFYAWGEPKFVFVIILSILINYGFGYIISWARNYDHKTLSKILMLLGISANCALLFYFKYFDFFISSVNWAAGTNISLKEIILPIGISFFTFQGLSYIIDIYFNRTPVQKNLLNFALFKSFFPQLIAGPIVRYVDVHQQIEKRESTVDSFAYGVRRFILGLGKKVIIANTLGQVADNIFMLPADQNSLSIAWLGAICYTFQIYYDFSGYSDMAIGLARMFGFKFKENFDFPYVSRSITEFWRRWHISLSSWFRDYLYIPLGGNRKGNVYLNLLIVFLVTGLWHGAAWNFVVWGLWHGMFIIIERLFKKSRFKMKLPSVFLWVYSMIVVIIGWVLFRSPNLEYASNYLKIMFGIDKSDQIGFTLWYYVNPMVLTMLGLACICTIPITKYFRNKIGDYDEHSGFSLFFQNAYAIIVLVVCMMFLATSTYNPFIYFRF
ncbi:MBOAT family protein [Paenibacillus sp. 2003]|uniref:MBOAT family O-acyltransferase n=1 Tax=Paenibacillus sp. 2003 TaxID=2817761 RepID=UPI00286C9A09|nr:MBOAT family protein [Paenibacillus sp. 2003]